MNHVIRDGSEDEREGEGHIDQEEEEFLNREEEIFLGPFPNFGKRPKFEVPTFLGNLNPKELINQINELRIL